MASCGSRVALCAAFAGLAMIGPDHVEADVFLLRGGGQIQGELLNPEESPRKEFLIQVAQGATVSLARDRVKRILANSSDEAQYQTIRPSFPDTAEGHWRLAAWCLERELLSHRRSHLERVLELDTNHEQARLALGHRKVNGRWMAREEEMESRGLKLYAGQYRTPQEIEIWEQEKKQNRAERLWHAKIKRWIGWLDSKKQDTALDHLQTIRDPTAVPGLVKYLEPSKDRRPPRQVKLLLMEILAQIESGEATGALVGRALYDSDQEVRLSAMDYLAEQDDPVLLARFIQALRSKENYVINRAAVALRSIGNPEAMGPLVDVLVTEHKYVDKGNAGQTTVTSNPDGGIGSMSFGGEGPKVIRKKLANPEVLSALVHLSDGANFQYDKKAWKHWLRSRNKAESVDVRRD